MSKNDIDNKQLLFEKYHYYEIFKLCIDIKPKDVCNELTYIEEEYDDTDDINHIYADEENEYGIIPEL